jgi:hypothetical protein
LINSIPYIKDWINRHPQSGNPNSILLCGFGKSLGRAIGIATSLNKPLPLNSEIVVDNSGNQTVEPETQTRQPDRSAETGINAYASKSEPASEITGAQQEEVVNANRPQSRPGIGIGSADQPVWGLEQALKNLKTINCGTGNHIEASSAHNRSYNSFDNTELSGVEEKERESHRKCKNCEILQQKYEQLQSKLQGYKEAVRTQTSIKTAKELIYRSADGYQRFEFSAPFEPLRQHMIAAFNSNSSVNRVWFNAKFNHKTGEVVDVRIGKTMDTPDVNKTSVVTNDDTLNDITRD